MYISVLNDGFEAEVRCAKVSLMKKVSSDRSDDLL